LDGRWVPTFPKAKYVFAKREYEYCEAGLKSGDKGWRIHHRAAYNDSVLPVIEAGQALIVDDGFELDDLISLEPTPGHTPGHVAIWLKSKAKRGVFIGDSFHHPLEVYYPHWQWQGCRSQTDAVASKKRVLERCADTDTIFFSAHFMGTHAGYVKSKAGEFR